MIATHGKNIPAPCAGAALSLHAPDERLSWHEHAVPYACLVLAGSFIESGRTSEAERRVGDIVLHPAGDRHADRFGPHGARCLNLRLPAGIRAGARRASAAVRVAAQSVAAQAALGPEGDDLVAESALAEILSELGPSPRGPLPASTARDRRPVDRITEALDDEPGHPWTLDELAAIAGRHPTHLARSFRLVAGMSIGEYRRRSRLVALFLDLRVSAASLGDLAAAHGYADQAHMTRDVRRFAGSPPGAWRRRLR